MRLLFSVLLLWLCSIPLEGQCNSVLKGSPASLLRQNQEADYSGLTRIEDRAELELFKEKGLLVTIPQTSGIKIDKRLDKQFHVVRPWTAQFLIDLGKNFKKRFKSSLQINSATRTVERQNELAKNNKNAAPATGDTRSSHLTGAAIDIAKKPLSRAQKKWLRVRLVELEKKDLIEATEEQYQAVFHIMVFPRYDQTVVRVALK
jgi:hypothetical protein